MSVSASEAAMGLTGDTGSLGYSLGYSLLFSDWVNDWFISVYF